MDRFYHIALFILAPFCIYGGTELIKLLLNIIKVNQYYTVYVVLFVVILFYFFNTGLIYAIVGDTPQLMLGKCRMEQSKDPNVKLVLYNSLINDKEVEGVTWLNTYRDKRFNVYADSNDAHQILVSYGMMDIAQPQSLTLMQPIMRDSYVYLGSFTTTDGYMYEPSQDYIGGSVIYPMDENKNIQHMNYIYNNGGSEVLTK
jgi:uncharacterized membrane protein